MKQYLNSKIVDKHQKRGNMAKYTIFTLIIAVILLVPIAYSVESNQTSVVQIQDDLQVTQAKVSALRQEVASLQSRMTLLMIMLITAAAVIIGLCIVGVILFFNNQKQSEEPTPSPARVEARQIYKPSLTGRHLVHTPLAEGPGSSRRQPVPQSIFRKSHVDVTPIIQHPAQVLQKKILHEDKNAISELKKDLKRDKKKDDAFSALRAVW